jgi:hypothetical protein
MSIKRVTTRAIEDSQITSAKIADGSITSGKIANSAVESAKIASGAVDATKIADNAVTVGKITDGAVSLNKLAANSVDAGKIADGAVTPAKLSAGKPIWDTYYTEVGRGVTGAYFLSLTPYRTGDGETQIIIGAQTATNDNAQIIRQTGVNGQLVIQNNGTAPIIMTSSSGVTFGSANMPTPTGTAPIYAARAWVNFNGTGTVTPRASGNVSSITDNGTGTYTVNFTTAMPDTNYSVNVTARRIDANNANFSAVLKGTTSANTNYPLSTGSCEVICGTPSNNAFVDSDVVCVSVFR